MTIKNILHKQDGVDINIKKLALGQVLSLSNMDLSLNKDRVLSIIDYFKYLRVVSLLKKKVPIQYISGRAYFYNRWFYVNKNTLIPRVETEYLVDETNKLINKYFSSSVKILDIGTGSGIIAITLASFSNQYEVVATDISLKALSVAKKNDFEGLVRFIHTDLYKDIDEKFDVVISNPPYIRNDSKDVMEQVKKYEPNLALFGGEDGLDFYRNILKGIKRIVNEKNIICFEVGEEQNDLIEKMALEVFPSAKIIKKKDLNNFDRYIFIINE